MSRSGDTSDEESAAAVERFKEYLRIQSVQPVTASAYNECVDWVRHRGQQLSLDVSVEQVAAGPVVIVTWQGSRPSLPSLLLSSHMDVVPVYPDKWTYPPFAAHEDAEGNIYARGAQDMKCVGVQYLEAVGRLINRGFTPLRNVYICFTPDEEIGSQGMKHFVETDTFKRLNVGCELDEGVASPDGTFHLFYGERTSYKLEIVCAGTTGHGSRLFPNTAGQKLAYVITKFMEKRSEEMKKLTDNPNLTLGDVTTINLTMLRGGIQGNVVPPELRVVFDCRVSLNENHDKFEEWVEEVCKKAGDGVSVLYPDKKKRIEPTELVATNLWWQNLKTSFNKMGLSVKPSIFAASTDARYIRNLGIPAFGFSPMNNTPVLLHDHDEFLNRSVFLKGIDIYMEIISALSST